MSASPFCSTSSLTMTGFGNSSLFILFCMLWAQRDQLKRGKCFECLSFESLCITQ